MLTVCGIEKPDERRDPAAAALLTALAWIVVPAVAATAVVRRSIRPAQAEGRWASGPAACSAACVTRTSCSTGGCGGHPPATRAGRASGSGCG
ncbi:MAG TPA: hypothetical protein VFM37_16340 [Pseudonocardiaceae bacterium]|nr:hypothetical protein [Pseudonocardiaceae bacterium]